MTKKLLYFVIFFAFSTHTFAQNTLLTDSLENRKIKIAFKLAPPFVIKKQNTYSGVSIDLWNKIALNLNLDFEYVEYSQDSFPQMLNDIENGKIDLCINPLTVTSERLERFEYTLPFYSSSMAIAVPIEEQSQIIQFILNFFSIEFFSAVLFLTIVLFIFGFIVWLVEKKKNPEFRQGIKGLADGFWWSAATMTTVGYGDISPRTFVGRTLGIVWMFTAIIVISSLTGSIAASLTVDEINSNINSIGDLEKHKVGTMKASSTEEYLFKNQVKIYSNEYTDVTEGLMDLKNQNIDVFIYDDPIIRYLLRKNELNSEIHILPVKLNAIYYSFSAPSGSDLIEKINPVLIKELESVNWIAIINKYNLQK